VQRVKVTGGGPGASGRTVRLRAAKMLDHLGLGEVELSVALVDDAAIEELNRTYRKKAKPTDVLSFPQRDGSPKKKPVFTDGELLGDVIVSLDTAERQARRRRRPLLDELTMLLAHGLLHLLGYDHRTDAEEREMVAKTRELEAAARMRGRRRQVLSA
jgi:probable rRNA maturation factor